MLKTREAIAALAEIEPGQVKSYALIVDDGSRQATVVTDLGREELATVLANVFQIVVTGEEK